ncbi:Zinc finger MYND domain-containing protein 19 [Blomia tropicalis]|nr:Zinc finger MYND domain-containing protein 19 [Blomia tropicalis]
MKDPLLINHEYNESPFGINGSRYPTRSTISTSESGQELWPVGVKLGIVRLGHAAGKLKYTLVDEQDIVLAREYTFEARLEVDLASASGAVVFAYAYLTRQNRNTAILLQDLIWRRHNGPIPERKRVVHRNHISMDNRLDNLCLIDIRNAHVWYTRTNSVKQTSGNSSSNGGNTAPSNDKSSGNDLHLTLYWAAIQQLPPETQSANNNISNSSSSSSSGANGIGNNGLNGTNNTSSNISNETSATSTNMFSSSASNSHHSHHNHHHHQHHHHHHRPSIPKCYDSDGNLIDSEADGIVYFECHYPPCVRIEREPREFSICGRCQETRYCGTMCQQLDWPHHKRHCRTKSSRRTAAPYWSHRWETQER